MPAQPTRTRRQSSPDVDGSGGGQTVLRHRSDRDYVVVQNAVARDARLSYRARGVLLEMISRPRDWRFSAERLARLSPKEGRDAIRTALAELRAAGYVLYTRERSSGGRWRTVVTVSDRPVQAWADAATVAAPKAPDDDDRAAAPAAPKTPAMPWPTWDEAFSQLAPKTGQPASESQASKEVRVHEVQKDKEETCLQLAPLAGTPDPPKTFDPTKRERDRELFTELLGGENITVVTDGRPWTKGRFSVEAMYDGLRRSRKVRYPGSYLMSIEENGRGLSDWFIDEGLSIEEPPPW